MSNTVDGIACQPDGVAVDLGFGGGEHVVHARGLEVVQRAGLGFEAIGGPFLEEDLRVGVINDEAIEERAGRHDAIPVVNSPQRPCEAALGQQNIVGRLPAERDVLFAGHD